jgi:hypothetical protein
MEILKGTRYGKVAENIIPKKPKKITIAQL